MNLFQRLIGLWWSLWAAARGLDVSRTAPLPAPAMPAVSGAALVAVAAARGAADGRSAMVDPWSFGGAGDAESEDYDLDYVRGLRHQREAALLSLRTAQRLTDDRVSVARRRRDEARERMAVAQERMSGLAADEEEARLRGLIEAADDTDITDDTGINGINGITDGTAIAASLGTLLGTLLDTQLDTQLDTPDDPLVPAGRTPWEGESSPLPVFWRLLILVGLAVVQAEVEFSLLERFTGTDRAGVGAARWLAAATSAIVVFGPFVAGTVLRTRAATGTDRRIGYAVLALVLSWLAAVTASGFIRARIFQAGQARPDTAHITFATVVVNPENGAPATADQERAIIEAYAAAENAYYAALAQAQGDPAFTEAVQHRRGLRTTA